MHGILQKLWWKSFHFHLEDSPKWNYKNKSFKESEYLFLSPPSYHQIPFFHYEIQVISFAWKLRIVYLIFYYEMERMRKCEFIAYIQLLSWWSSSTDLPPSKAGRELKAWRNNFVQLYYISWSQPNHNLQWISALCLCAKVFLSIPFHFISFLL